MTSPIASPASQTIAAIVFGIAATSIGLLALWQSYRVGLIWLTQHRRLLGDLESSATSRD